jgi:hypothetical protein
LICYGIIFHYKRNVKYNNKTIFSASNSLLAIRNESSLSVFLFNDLFVLFCFITLESFQIRFPREEPDIIHASGGEFISVELVETDVIEVFIGGWHFMGDHGFFVYLPIPERYLLIAS